MAPLAAARQRAVAAELCAAYRRWAPAEPRAPLLRGELPGGHSNRSLLLEGQRARYVLRFAADDHASGLDRERECRLATAAAGRALGPPVLFCDPRRGLMITEFTGQALRGVPDSGALGELLRGIHGLPAIGAPVSGSDRLRHYRSLLPPDSRSEALLARHAPRLAACCAQVDASPVSPVTCHNDLIAANLRQCGSRLIALDWEYAAPGDVYFDLAVCVAELGVQEEALLDSYLQRSPTGAERRHLRAQHTVYTALASCWYEHFRPGSTAAAAALDALAATLGAARHGSQPE